MILENKKLIQAIVNLIANSATEDEVKEINLWLSENEENQNILHYLKQITYSGSLHDAERSKEKIFQLVNEKITRNQYQKKLILWKYLAVASLVALIAISGFLLVDNNIAKKQNVVYVETTAKYGTTSKIMLNDGSVVLLNSGSTLKYPAQFTKKHRVVSLSGEAFFDITENKEHPFIVNTDKGKIKVLGTKFNLKDYIGDNKAIITLQEGSISFQKHNLDTDEQPIILSPNQQIVYNKKQNSLEINDVNPSFYKKWENGGYYFEKEPFAEILKQLERGFNVKIKFQDAGLGKEVFSGIFDKEENIQQILDVFKRYKHFEYQVNGNEILIIDKHLK